GSHQKSGLQILGRSPGIADRKANNRSDDERQIGISRTLPTHREKYETGPHQHGDGHSGKRARRASDDSCDPGRYHRKQKSEDHDQDSAQKVHPERRHQPDEERKRKRTDRDHRNWSVSFRTRKRSAAGKAGSFASELSNRSAERIPDCRKSTRESHD